MQLIAPRQHHTHTSRHTDAKHLLSWQVEGFLSECPQMAEASRVSMVTLSADVQMLRKGIDLILYEREKQQNNFIIYAFYLNAVHKGAARRLALPYWSIGLLSHFNNPSSLSLSLCLSPTLFPCKGTLACRTGFVSFLIGIQMPTSLPPNTLR